MSEEEEEEQEKSVKKLIDVRSKHSDPHLDHKWPTNSSNRSAGQDAEVPGRVSWEI